jgi:hypothetical protein
MAPLIAAALKLAPMIPGLTGLLFGDRAAAAADKVVGVAKALTGQDDPDDAIKAVKADPVLMIQMQKAVMDFQLAVYAQDTERLKAVNETMRAELASGDTYTRRWRPSFGYAAALTWTLQGFVFCGLLVYVALWHHEQLSDVINAVTAMIRALADHWMYAMTVLGVAVWKRSEDKRSASGVSEGGIVGALADRIRGRKGE